jgi:hypothetical protein
MANITPHDLEISLGTSQVRAKVRRHLWIVVRPPLPHRVALDVLVQMWLNERATFQTDRNGPVRGVIDRWVASRVQPGVQRVNDGCSRDGRRRVGNRIIVAAW